MQLVQAAEPLPALLTVAEVAHALRVDVTTIYRAVERGEVKALRLGDRGFTVRIPLAELERWLEESRVQPKETR